MTKKDQKYYYVLNIKENSVLPNPEIVYSLIINDPACIETIKKHAQDEPSNKIILCFNKPSKRPSIRPFLAPNAKKRYFRTCFISEIISAQASEFSGFLCLFRLLDYFESDEELQMPKVSAKVVSSKKLYSDAVRENYESLSEEQKMNCENLLQKNADLLLSMDLNFVESLFVNGSTDYPSMYTMFFNFCIPYLNLTESAYETYMCDSDITRKLEFIGSVLQKRLILSNMEKINGNKAAKIVSTYKDIKGKWADDIKNQEIANMNLDINDIKSAHKFIITSAQPVNHEDDEIANDNANSFIDIIESTIGKGDMNFLSFPSSLPLPFSMSDSKKKSGKKNAKKTFYEKYSDEHKFAEKTQKYIDFLNQLDAPIEVKEEIADEIHHIQTMAAPISSEYSTSIDYLETCTKIPFGKYSDSDFDIEKAKEIIEKSHYGMKDVKRRINEFLTLHKLSGSQNGAIICLVGPPGVGKTSIARSIAKALGREYFRFSAGGVSDEAEFIGHRRTYVASQPGKIVQGVSKVKVMNPVFLIDEIDKISGVSHRGGDPLGTLLNILDPEQNKAFTDLYLNFPLDLSKIVFILTANDISSLPLPLIDRMEIIDVASYTTDEKVEIFKNHLLDKTIEELNIKDVDVDRSSFTDKEIEYLIKSYTREAGVRGLKKQFEKLLRSEIEEQYSSGKKFVIDLSKKALLKHLGAKKFDSDDELKINSYGTSIGLAWTEIGGTALKIETIETHDGKGELKLTGQLGDVMKESADIAFTYLKHIVDDKDDYFTKNNFHLHIPEGATPKDGPSAGITMLTAFYSLYNKKKIKPGLAMTGELTLTGDVMPIGGLREKLYAAKSNNIKEVLIPKKNEKDLEEVDEKIKKNLKIKFVDKAEEVLRYAFEEV